MPIVAVDGVSDMLPIPAADGNAAGGVSDAWQALAVTRFANDDGVQVRMTVFLAPLPDTAEGEMEGAIAVVDAH
ncbi:MAG: hypothetical protein OXG11_07265 [Chloroflexi bacterium]|nr:hypothetical protein [Chloroflexota bacterium]